MATEILKPYIIIDEVIDREDPEQDAAVRERIEFIDHRMQLKPEQFTLALNRVGPTAVKETRSLRDKREPVRNVPQRPADLIMEFFRERYDWHIVYDKTTEVALRDDPYHQHLIQLAIQRGPDSTKTSRTGATQAAQHERTPADEARDKIRISEVRTYLGLLATYHQQTVKSIA